MNQSASGQIIEWNDLFSRPEFWHFYYARQLDFVNQCDDSFEPNDFLSRYLAELDFNENFALLSTDFEKEAATTLRFEIALPAKFRLIFTFALDGKHLALWLSYPDYAVDPPTRSEWLLGSDGTLCGAAYCALRWEELLVISKCFERLPEPPCEPHFFLLLLKKFAPTVSAGEWERVQAVMGEAWRAAKVFNELELFKLTTASVLTHVDLQWVYDEERGFVVTGKTTDAPRYYDPEPEILPEETTNPVKNAPQREFNFAVFRQFIREITAFAGVTFAEAGIPLYSKDGEHPLERLRRVLEAYSTAQLSAGEANQVSRILPHFGQAFEQFNQLSPKTTLIMVALAREFFRETAKYGYRQLEYVETPEQIAETRRLEKQIKRAMRGKLIEFLDAQEAAEWQEIIGEGDEHSPGNLFTD